MDFSSGKEHKFIFLLPLCSKIWLIISKHFELIRRKQYTIFFSEKIYNYIILLPFCSKILIDVRWIVQTVFDLIGRTVWTNFFEENLQLYELTPILFENFGWCSPICFRPLDQKTFWTIYHLRAITALSSCSYLAIKLVIDVLQSVQMVFVWIGTTLWKMFIRRKVSA